jgi:tetratricopeptide (TPR) repeat protein
MMAETSVETLVESAQRRSPESVELARWVCLATRIEPALLRRARLSLIPGTGSHAEADLWLGPLVQTRGAQFIMFYPEVSNRLRQELIEGTAIDEPGHRDPEVRHKTKKLLKAWKLVREMHANLLHLVRFEEELTWLALTADDAELARGLDQHLRRVIKTIVAERSSGLGHWALSILPRLPPRARTKTTKILQMVSEAHLYGGWFSYDPEAGEPLSEEERALLLQSMEQIAVGVRLLEDNLEFSSPPTEGAQKIYVPATNPLALELNWRHDGEARGATLKWDADTRVVENGVTPPVSITTITGDSYRVAAQSKIIEDLKKIVSASVVCLLDSERRPRGTGLLLRGNAVLVHENSLFGAVMPQSDARMPEAANVLLRLPLMPDDGLLTAKVSRQVSRAGMDEKIEGFVLLSLNSPDLDWARPVKLKPGLNMAGRSCVAFGYPPHKPDGGWIRVEVQDAHEGGRYPLKLATEVNADKLESWAGALVVDYAAGELVGMLQPGYSPSDMKQPAPYLITLDALQRAFPEDLKGRLHVFLSSTWLDLQPERKAVEAGLQRLRADAGFVGMEYFGSREENIRRASLDEVDRSHVYVGIFAARYGSGITEDEYRRARAHGLPCFIYFKAESTITFDKVEKNPELLAKLDKLKAELRQAHTVTEFIHPEDLAAKVTADLHRWIINEYLSQDTASQTPRPPVATLHQLRAPVSDFVGREKEIANLIDALRKGESAGISGISGMGGIGKTELALLVANRLRPDYSDAQLFIDMRGTADRPLAAADALAACVRAFMGADAKLPEDLNELINLYRSSLDGKRALILLDNAADSAQVRPLIPPSGCALLVTSRETLALPGMKRLTLEQLQPQEARDLLTGIAPRTPPDIADRICYFCGYLPLAIRAAGSLLDITTDLDPAVYATQLHDERERLTHIGKEGVDLDVEASLELSYARLQPETARVFRQLSVFPGAFDAQAEEEMCEDPGHVQLSDLLRRSLVLYHSTTARYRLHDLVRLFAATRLNEHEASTGQWRHARHYLNTLEKAERLYLHGGEAVMRGLALFETEWPNISAGQAWAAQHTGEESAAKLCSEYPLGAMYLLGLRLSPRERIGWLESGLTAARSLKQRKAEGLHLVNLGVAFRTLGEMRRAVDFLEQSLSIFRELGDPNGEGFALANIGESYDALGDARLAIEYFDQALNIYRSVGDRRGEGQNLGALGNAYAALGQTQHAQEFYEQALTIAREIGDLLGERQALGNLGKVFADLGETRRAIECLEQALTISRRIGDRRGEGQDLGTLGNAYAALGETQRAQEFYEHQTMIAREIGDRRGESLALGNLGTAYASAGEVSRAVEFYQQALELARAVGDRRYEGATLFNLSLTYEQVGDREAAINHSRTALEILERIEHPGAGRVRKQLAEWRAEGLST